MSDQTVVQPISEFVKWNEPRRIIDCMRFNPLTIAIQTSIAHSMINQVAQCEVAFSTYYANIFGCKERHARDSLKELEDKKFLVDREPKSLTVNPLLANKEKFLSRQMQQLIVHPDPLTEREAMVLAEIERMKWFNQKSQKYIRKEVKETGMQGLAKALDATITNNQLLSDLLREAEMKNSNQQAEMNKLTAMLIEIVRSGIVSQETVEKVRSHLSLVPNK